MRLGGEAHCRREDKIYRNEHDTSWSSLQVLVRGACRGAEGDEAGGEAGASMGWQMMTPSVSEMASRICKRERQDSTCLLERSLCEKYAI